MKHWQEALHLRQNGCEVYGDYLEYIGTCEDTGKLVAIGGI